MGTIDTIGSDATQIAPRARLITRRNTFGLLRRIRYAIAIWSEKRRGRAILRTLTDDQLWDIGLTRREAEGEASKSFFWD
jgi:uncharacterized protein YjiS (DUF1127 family)